MSTVSQLGTFDLENFGDLLYPLVFRQFLNQLDSPVNVHQFSLLPGSAPLRAGFVTDAARDLFRPDAKPCNLVIGGGDLLRTDFHVVAAHYHTRSGGSLSDLRHSIGTYSVPEYFIRTRLPRLRADSFHAEQLRSRWLDYPAPGPFIIDPAELPKGSTTAYMSCGVPHEFSPDDRESISKILDKSSFFYVRDGQSAEKLRRAGVRCQLRVAPDMMVILSDQFDHLSEINKGRALLAQQGVDTTRPILCFQSQPYPGFNEATIFEQLRHYQANNNAEIVLLPIGLCHGDREFLQRIGQASDGVFKQIAVGSVLDIISVIAACQVFVGTSLHGNITAFSYGIPHLFGPLSVDKAAGFLKVVNLPLTLQLCSWEHLNQGLDHALTLGTDVFKMKAREAKTEVYAALNDLLRAVLK